MTTHRTKPNNCPVCNYKLDSVSPLMGKEPPVKGDLTVCFGCAAPLTFNEDLTVREITDQEIKALSKKEFDQLTFIQSEIYHFKLNESKTKKP